MFQTKVVEKIKTYVLRSVTFFSENHNILWHTRFACWITNATNTHLEHTILILFPW